MTSKRHAVSCAFLRLKRAFPDHRDDVTTNEISVSETIGISSQAIGGRPRLSLSVLPCFAGRGQKESRRMETYRTGKEGRKGDNMEWRKKGRKKRAPKKSAETGPPKKLWSALKGHHGGRNDKEQERWGLGVGPPPTSHLSCLSQSFDVCSFALFSVECL